MIFKTETGNKNGNEILIGPNIPMIESRFFWLSHTFEIGGITILDIRSIPRTRKITQAHEKSPNTPFQHQNKSFSSHASTSHTVMYSKMINFIMFTLR